MRAIGLALVMIGLAMPAAAARREQFAMAPGFDVPASFNDTARGGATYHITVLHPAAIAPDSLNVSIGGLIRYWQNVGIYREFDTVFSLNRNLCDGGGCLLTGGRVTAQFALPGPEQPSGPECADQLFVQCRFSYGPFAVTLDHGYQSAAGGTVTVLAYSGGVPEPSSWAMLLAGFAAVGGAARRRRFNRPAPATTAAPPAPAAGSD